MRKGGRNVKYKAIKSKLYLNKNQRTFLLMLMHTSKNLYNEALYNVRQHYFETNTYLDYNSNYKLLSRNSDNYRILNTQQAQAVIRKVDEAMKAFFGSLRSRVNHKVRLPRYLKKDGHYPIFDRMVYKPNQDHYVLPRSNFIKRVSKYVEETKNCLDKQIIGLDVMESLKLEIETPRCITNKQIKEITIKPKYDGKYIEVIHTYIDEEETVEKENKRTENMGIDFGYNNLATCAVSNGNNLLIDGLKLKSLNQYYHKRISLLASKRPNQKVLTKKMISLIEKRNNQMTYAINKAAKLIIERAVTNDVGKIIIGYNEGFKDITLNDQYNQWSKSIPISRLKDRIIYLAEQEKIETIVINEAYTSKASYIDKDELSYQESFSGRRIKRGLYLSKDKILINADLNAALNIIRKGNPEAKWIGTKGWNTPKRTYLFSRESF